MLIDILLPLLVAAVCRLSLLRRTARPATSGTTEPGVPNQKFALDGSQDVPGYTYAAFWGPAEVVFRGRPGLALAGMIQQDQTADGCVGGGKGFAPDPARLTANFRAFVIIEIS